MAAARVTSAPPDGWLIEHGIGETRAALVSGGTIVEALIALPDAVRVGTIAPARLVDIVAPGRIGLAMSDLGEALLQPLPPTLTIGTAITVEITREAIGHKRPLCRLAGAGDAPRDGPDLAARVAARGGRVRIAHAHEEDALDGAGWGEALEAAETGVIPFAGGGLLMSPTPAMTLFDVDGTLPPGELAVAGARSAAHAIQLFDITGSIGIDLPTVADKAVRTAAAAALDDALPRPFERTAVNGFGFVQIVRPCTRGSLPQMLARDRVGAHARALLRRGERAAAPGPRTLVAHPSVVSRLEQEPAWIAELARRTGVPIGLRVQSALAISSGYVAPSL